MSNYSQITNFAAKDALITGDPNKKIVGSTFDAEFAAISTAIASKISDVTGQAVLESQITDSTILARVGSNETVSGTWNFTAQPTVLGNPIWHSGNDGTGTSLDADLLDGQHGSYYQNATNLTAGTVADARLSANVPLLNATNIWANTALFSNNVTFSGSCAFQATVTYGPSNNEIGFRGVPQNWRNTNYTLVLDDAGRHIHHAAGAGAGDIYTIPANASVAYPLGTVLTFTNLDAALTIAITTDTMYLAGAGTTGSRTLAQYGIATAIKVETNVWMISGTGLS